MHRFVPMLEQLEGRSVPAAILGWKFEYAVPIAEVAAGFKEPAMIASPLPPPAAFDMAFALLGKDVRGITPLNFDPISGEFRR